MRLSLIISGRWCFLLVTVAFVGNQGVVGIGMGARGNVRLTGAVLPGRSSRKIGLAWAARWWPPALYLFGWSLTKVAGPCIPPAHVQPLY